MYMYSEGHPIPQDISGFQFRLIGDMTVKQFSYLAGGAILAWISFSFPMIGILKFLLAIICGLIAVSLAFLPIDGRPADIMLVLFLKALIKPNQYLYKQKNATAIIDASTDKKTTVGHDNLKIPQEKVVEEEKVTITANPVPLQPTNQSLNTQPEEGPSPIPIPEQKDSEDAHGKETEEKQLSEHASQIIAALAAARKHEEKATGNNAEEAHQKVLELETKLQDALSQRQILERRLIELEQKLAQSEKTNPIPISQPEQDIATEQASLIQEVPQDMKSIIGAPLIPNVPNLIAGVVKDPRGNVLTNILIEVKDRDGNPVRAFKTNPLGQFASATPLTNGVYTVNFEDPKKQQSFQSVEINAVGEYINPIEVISTDARETLRKELFK